SECAEFDRLQRTAAIPIEKEVPVSWIVDDPVRLGLRQASDHKSIPVKHARRDALEGVMAELDRVADRAEIRNGAEIHRLVVRTADERAVESEGVVAGTAHQGVLAAAAGEDVVPASAREQVVAAPANEVPHVRPRHRVSTSGGLV